MRDAIARETIDNVINEVTDEEIRTLAQAEYRYLFVVLKCSA